MPHLVVFEIEDEQLLVAIGQVSPRNLKVEQTLEIDLSDDDSDDEIGQRLRRFLSTHGVHRADAIAVVSRSSAEIRELTVPPAPDNELPDMVRFKARSDFGSLNDNWSLDFVPFSDDPEQPRQVLAAAISPELSSQIKLIAESAGVKLKHIVFRPYATVDLLRSKLTNGKCRIIVDETDDQTDISLTKGSSLIATRTVRIQMNQDSTQRASQLLREVRLTLTSMKKRLEGEDVSEIIICGGRNDEVEPLETRFTEQVKVETHVVDPFSLVRTGRGFKRPEHTQSFTALLGALNQHVSDGSHTIDFLNPRRPIASTTDFRKFYRIGGIIAASLLLMGILGWWVLATQKSRIADLRQQLDGQNTKNQSSDNPQNNVDSILAEVTPIDKFMAEDTNWLDELYEISGRMKTPDDIIVDSFEAGNRRSGPRIDIKGRVADSTTETSIRRDLIQRPYVEVMAGKSNPADDPNYGETFELQIKLEYDQEEQRLQHQNERMQQVKKEINLRAIELLKSRNQKRTLPDESETNTQ